MKKGYLILIVAVLVIAIVAVGVWVGFTLGKKKAVSENKGEVEKLTGIVDLVFPPPSETISTLTGTIKAMYGATIHFEVNDPDDYLPHTDGSPQKKQVRFASLTGATKILLIDSTQIDKDGNPKITELKQSDLKAGDVITVRSEQNIKSAEKFDVTQIELVKY